MTARPLMRAAVSPALTTGVAAASWQEEVVPLAPVGSPDVCTRRGTWHYESAEDQGGAGMAQPGQAGTGSSAAALLPALSQLSVGVSSGAAPRAGCNPGASASAGGGGNGGDQPPQLRVVKRAQ